MAKWAEARKAEGITGDDIPSTMVGDADGKEVVDIPPKLRPRDSVGTAAGELALEFLHAPGGVHETLFAREGGVRIHGHVTHHDMMVDVLVILGLA